MHGFPADLRLAARRLLATPLFTTFAVLSLAIGIGVTTAVYSVVDSIFLRDPGFREPDRVAFVVTPYDGRFLKGSISRPDFEDLRAAQTSFSGLSASAAFSPAVTTASTTELLTAEAVDGEYFETLGVTAAIGRVIQPADDAVGARVVVLNHGLWRRRFSADPGIVGQTIRIAGHPFEVIGVAPAAFEGAAGGFPATRLWIPLDAEASVASADTSLIAPRDRRRLVVFGRLAPGTTVTTASAEVAAIAASLDAAFPPLARAAQPGPTERPWKTKSIAAIVGEDNFLRRVGQTLVGLVALVLAVACTNLANLVLARGDARQHELSVRRALGASRWRLVRSQGAESLLVAIAGAVAAWIVFQGLRGLMDVEFNVPLPMGERWVMAIQPTLDGTALGVAGTALLISLAVFGLEPALRLTRVRDVRGALAASAGGAASLRAGRQRTLLRWQVAVAAGFFIIATMFVRYTIAEARHDSGVETSRLGVAVLNFQTQQWDEARVRRAVDRLLEEARRSPAVEAASASTGMPFGVRPMIRLSLSVPDAAGRREGDRHRTTGIAVTPSIFRTLGVPILRGRGFDERDHAGAAPVVVLSALTARRIFGTVDAVGRRLALETQLSDVQMATVIGVAGDTDVWRLFDERRAFVYLPFAQRYDPVLTIAARSTGDAASAVRALREALRRADPDLAIDAIGTGRTMLSGPYVFLRAAGMAALGLGALTLLLAMVGLFGIQSHIVANRTREIGVRMSVGATAVQIKGMVLKDGYRPVLEGLGLGLFVGLSGRAIVRAYLDIDVSIVDPWMLLVVPVPLILAAFCASYLPAHRAAAVEPSSALRHL